MFLRLQFGLFFIALVNVAIAQNNVRHVLDQMISHDTDINFDKTPGFIVAVIDGDSTFIESFGKSLISPDESLTKFDLFEIGGLSKVVTAMLFLDILSTYQIELTDQIRKHFPSYLKSKINRNAWTYQELLTHNTGLPKIPIGLGKKEIEPRSPYAHYTIEDLFSFIQKYDINKDKEFIYSHINYAIIEHIIEDITRKDFDIVLTEYLNKKYNIHQTSINTSDTITPGFTRAQKRSYAQQFKSFGASLGIKSTLKDLIVLLRSLISIQDDISNEYLSPIQNLRIKTTLDKRLFFSGGMYRSEHKKFYPIYTHSGRSNGHYAFIGMVPETRTGVVILANSIEGTEDLGMLTLRTINDTWKRKATGK